LAKALLVFSDGGLIQSSTDFDVLLAYGASIYGHGKLSFDARVQWSLNNLSNFQLLDPSWLKSAKSPLLFIAFCFEIKNNFSSILNRTPYVSHFPLQWDCTCNGLQHLSALRL